MAEEEGERTWVDDILDAAPPLPGNPRYNDFNEASRPFIPLENPYELQEKNISAVAAQQTRNVGSFGTQSPVSTGWGRSSSGPRGRHQYGTVFSAGSPIGVQRPVSLVGGRTNANVAGGRTNVQVTQHILRGSGNMNSGDPVSSRRKGSNSQQSSGYGGGLNRDRSGSGGNLGQGGSGGQGGSSGGYGGEKRVQGGSSRKRGRGGSGWNRGQGGSSGKRGQRGSVWKRSQGHSDGNPGQGGIHAHQFITHFCPGDYPGQKAEFPPPSARLTGAQRAVRLEGDCRADKPGYQAWLEKEVKIPISTIWGFQGRDAHTPEMLEKKCKQVAGALLYIKPIIARKESFRALMVEDYCALSDKGFWLPKKGAIHFSYTNIFRGDPENEKDQKTQREQLLLAYKSNKIKMAANEEKVEASQREVEYYKKKMLKSNAREDNAKLMEENTTKMEQNKRKMWAMEGEMTSSRSEHTREMQRLKLKLREREDVHKKLMKRFDASRKEVQRLRNVAQVVRESKKKLLTESNKAIKRLRARILEVKDKKRTMQIVHRGKLKEEKEKNVFLREELERALHGSVDDEDEENEEEADEESDEDEDEDEDDVTVDEDEDEDEKGHRGHKHGRSATKKRKTKRRRK